jgi:hypothetical protein
MFFVPYIYVADRPYNPKQDKHRKTATTNELMNMKAEVSFVGSGWSVSSESGGWTVGGWLRSDET